MDRERIRELIDILKSSGAGEIQVREGDFRVRLRKRVDGAVAAEATVNALGGDESCCPAVEKPEPEVSQHVEVRSQLVGLFHRGRGPGAEPLAQAGDQVSAGQLIGTIEALRNFTDVTSPMDGTVVQVIAEDGQPVQYGDPLLAIKPSA